MLSLENAMCQILIPAFTGRMACSDLKCELLGLPVRVGGMGSANPATSSPHTFSASEQLTLSLVALIVAQDTDMAADVSEAQNIKKSIRQSNRQQQEEAANAIYDRFPPQLQRCVDLATEKTFGRDDRAKAFGRDDCAKAFSRDDHAKETQAILHCRVG